MPSTLKAARNKKDTIIHICPNCGSKKTNQVSLFNFYCLECDVEYDFKTGKVYTIEYNGSLVDYYENEFADLY